MSDLTPYLSRSHSLLQQLQPKAPQFEKHRGVDYYGKGAFFNMADDLKDLRNTVKASTTGTFNDLTILKTIVEQQQKTLELLAQRQGAQLDYLS